MNLIRIETDRLRLREPRPEDAEPLHRAVFSDPEAMRFIGNGQIRTLEQIEFSVRRKINCLEEHGFTLFTVVEQSTGEIVGDCGVLPIAWQGPVFELAYRLGRAFWGRGYATEAARAALAFTWSNADLDTVHAVTDLRNEPSQRVLTKLGFTDLGSTDEYYNELLRHFRLARPTPEPRA